MSRMSVVAPEVRACFPEAGTATVSYFIDGKSGRVTELTLTHGDRAATECVRRAFDRICFARFRQPRFGVTFPFVLSGPSAGKVGAAKSLVPGNQCWTVADADAPPSAAPDPAEEARRSYTARYSSQCKIDAKAKPLDDPSAAPSSIPQIASQAVLAQHMAEVSACYDEALTGWPAIAGHLEIALRVSPSGTVQDSSIVESDLAIALVACCIREAARAWVFPASAEGAAVVRYPFSLRP
jgi:hypothetical protein